MGSCPSREFSWWGSRPGGDWGVVLVGNYPGGELSYSGGIVLVGSCCSGESSW